RASRGSENERNMAILLLRTATWRGAAEGIMFLARTHFVVLKEDVKADELLLGQGRSCAAAIGRRLLENVPAVSRSSHASLAAQHRGEVLRRRPQALHPALGLEAFGGRDHREGK